MRLLLIEDNEPIAQMIAQGLTEAGYAVEVAKDGTTGYELANTRMYAAILLDLMLPGMDGWEICEVLRSKGNSTPILMLTARDAVPDRVRGLELGADDYLPKPFDFNELRARIKSLVRRDRVHKAPIIHVGDLEIDTIRRHAVRAGRDLVLTPHEYDLLVALASHEGQVFTRDVIRETVWMDDDSYSNTVDVRIAALRRKLDDDSPVKLIHTVHRIGYTLKRPPEEHP
jgi:two-component system copper resistance phosphate regulon response regulator CusR